MTDFGPIEEAKIDLRPLSVFVGPSNTGKSHLSILTYALHRFFGGGSSRRGWPMISGLRFGRGLERRDRRRDLPDESIKALFELGESLASLSFGEERTAEKDIILPPQVVETLQSDFEDSAPFLARGIARCFGMDIDNLAAMVRKDQSDANVDHASTKVTSCEFRI